MKRCPKCGAPARADDVFCEADGTRLVLAEPLEGGVAAVPPGKGGTCAACGKGGADDGDGYCMTCGMRLAPPPSTRAPELMRLEVIVAEGDPTTAAACHAGLRRDHNEDAIAVAGGTGRGGPWSVLVVCDGVSSSTQAGRAATTAARTARDALSHFARSEDVRHDAVAGAVASVIRAAHVAVCAEARGFQGDDGPGTTIVAALVHGGRLTVGWVGDSRAYWVTESSAELLTRDHSWLNETVARGERTEAEALLAPMAHVITRCLGPLEVGRTLDLVDPDVRVRDLENPGCVLLCTDGLWNYFAAANDIAALVRGVGLTATPEAIARALVGHALARGGGDNIGIAVHTHAASTKR